MNIKEAIKKLRHKRGFTQKELGEKIGIARSNVSQYESGARTPQIERCYELAEALDINPLLLVALRSGKKEHMQDAEKEINKILDK